MRETVEQRLMVRCCQLQIDAACGATSVDAEEIDWDLLLRAAREHHVIPFVARHIEGVAECPPQMEQTLRTERLVIAVHGLRLAAELAALAGAFEREGLAMLPFKGPVLAQYVFQDLGARDFTDLDIAVPPRQMPAALRLLQGRGYLVQESEHERRRAALARTFGHFVARHPESGVIVEAHPGASERWSRAQPSVDELLARCETVVVAGHALPTLARADLIVYLCVHGAKHVWKRLEWLTTMAALVHADDCDFSQLLALAEAQDARRRLLLGLHLAHVVLQVSLPPAVVAAIDADRHVNELSEYVQQRFTAGFGAQAPTADDSLALQLDFHARSMDRARDRVRMVARRTFGLSEADVPLADLPDRLTILYLPLRIVRLALRSLQRAWGAAA